MKAAPQIIGHRGAKAYAPENTLASIHTAADLGIEWVEVDVKLTADNIPVLFHDETLERTTNGSGKMAETSYAELQNLSAGSWFSESFADEAVPTLEQAIEACIERGLGLNLEIKPCPGREVETAEVALDTLSRYWDDHDRLLISSFSQASLETAQHMVPDWSRGHLTDAIDGQTIELARHVGAKTININGNHPDLTQDSIETLIDAGFPVLAFTINDPDHARRLIAMGVDGVFSDNPDQILLKH
mgnify:CR=1 FL=1